MKARAHNCSPRRAAARDRRAQCKRVFARLSEFLDGELAGRDGQKLERHLERCRPCLAYLESLETTIAACRQYGALEPSAAPRRLLARLERLLGIAGKLPRARRTSAAAGQGLLLTKDAPGAVAGKSPAQRKRSLSPRRQGIALAPPPHAHYNRE